MSGEIETICELSGCSKEDAIKAWEEFEDIVEAVDNLLPGKTSRKRKELSEEQQFFKEMRETLKKMDEKWQQYFLTWGVLVAVFGMRLIFPIV